METGTEPVGNGTIKLMVLADKRKGDFCGTRSKMRGSKFPANHVQHRSCEKALPTFETPPNPHP